MKLLPAHKENQLFSKFNKSILYLLFGIGIGFLCGRCFYNNRKQSVFMSQKHNCIFVDESVVCFQ